MQQLIFHILNGREWEAAKKLGTYAPLSLHTEGFIHCSTAHQLAGTANNFFRGQDGLVVLCIDEALLKAPLKYEAPAHFPDPQAGSKFPHIHGPLNTEAVVRIVDFARDSGGIFRLPSELAKFGKADG